MSRNIEIKARIASIAELEPRVAAIATDGPIPIEQDDTFFVCASGRLKLRTPREETSHAVPARFAAAASGSRVKSSPATSLRSAR